MNPSLPEKPALVPLDASLPVEESRAKRIQRQQARFRDRGGIFVPSSRNTLADILLGNRAPLGHSPKKARKSVAQWRSSARKEGVVIREPVNHLSVARRTSPRKGKDREQISQDIRDEKIVSNDVIRETEEQHPKKSKAARKQRLSTDDKTKEKKRRGRPPKKPLCRDTVSQHMVDQTTVGQPVGHDKGETSDAERMLPKLKHNAPEKSRKSKNQDDVPSGSRRQKEKLHIKSRKAEMESHVTSEVEEVVVAEKDGGAGKKPTKRKAASAKSTSKYQRPLEWPCDTVVEEDGDGTKPKKPPKVDVHKVDSALEDTCITMPKKPPQADEAEGHKVVSKKRPRTQPDERQATQVLVEDSPKPAKRRKPSEAKTQPSHDIEQEKPATTRTKTKDAIKAMTNDTNTRDNGIQSPPRPVKSKSRQLKENAGGRGRKANSSSKQSDVKVAVGVTGKQAKFSGPRKSVLLRIKDPLPVVDDDEPDPIDFLS